MDTMPDIEKQLTFRTESRGLKVKASVGKSPITQVVLDLLKQYRGDPCSINSGNCDEFAGKLASKLESLGYSVDILESGGFFSDVPVVQSNTVSDYGDSIPAGYSVGDLDDILNDATHVWVFVDGKHYDSETPRGVTKVFNLPFFRRYLKSGIPQHLLQSGDDRHENGKIIRSVVAKVTKLI